jgi:hypothetical protein
VGTHAVVLGYDWLRAQNPDIDWRNGTIDFAHYLGQREPAAPGAEAPEDTAPEQAADAPADAEDNDLEGLADIGFDEHLALRGVLLYCARGGGEIPNHLADIPDLFNLDYAAVPLNLKHGVEFTLDTVDNKLPPPARVIPMSPADLEEEGRQIAKLQAANRIEPSTSSTAAATFLVNKACLDCHQLRCSCGHRNHERRWVINYKPINAMTPQDVYPIPSVPELMATVPGHRYYTKFDIAEAFHLVPVRPADRHKMAFVCSRGLFQPTVMNFGLKNAPATWQRLIDTVLTPARAYCRAFFDDGIIWGDDLEQHHRDVRHVFGLLHAAGLRVKLRKCAFDQPEVPFLGYILGTNGIRTDPAKLTAIREYPEPRTKRDVQGFLGLVNFYRNHYRSRHGFSHDAEPLTRITGKAYPDTFTTLPDDAAAAFRLIRDYWSDPAHLGVYKHDRPTDLHTDASLVAWAGAIAQDGVPLTFGSGKFTPEQKNWSTTDRELYATLAMHKANPHLLTGDVTWYTDHKALEALRTTLTDTPRRARWAETLDRFPFKIRHVPGKTLHVDGLSRHSTYGKDLGPAQPVLSPDRFT